MHILSDPTRDTRTVDQSSGGYEWWYFDAVSADGRYSFVVIFYEGNPFSTRYIKALEGKADSAPMPSDYPAVSISVYEQENPVYYSFTEFNGTDCTFSEERPFVEIGPHRMESIQTEDQLSYSLSLDEELPNGDRLQAELIFESPPTPALFEEEEDDSPAGHRWNLAQPRAEASGIIKIGSTGEGDRAIAFQGTGYHDHNTGDEPMRDEFFDWYWGRFHFDYATLVFYVMNRKNEQEHQAWLIDPSGGKIIKAFDQVEVSDKSLSLFGLYSARKLNFQAAGAEMRVQQSQVIDNGPFYQRFLSDGFLRVPGGHVLESQQGITEYIYPGRIYSRIFWPLVKMRIRHAHKKPHWVQRSKQLYRWTW